MRRSFLAVPSLVFLVASLGLGACASPEGASSSEDDFSSNQATLLDFEFDGELVTDSSWNAEQTVEDQLLYTIGHLNFDDSVGRLDAVELTNVKKTTADGKVKITYHAKLPVAWGSKTNLPKTYVFSLPRDVSRAGTEAFTKKYVHDCVEFGAHDVDAGSMWYYYRPQLERCELASAEIVRLTATATKSKLNSTEKYPEYHEIWADDRFESIAIFGKYEETGGAFDSGVSAFNTFVRNLKKTLGPNVVVTPAGIADRPGPDVKDVTFEAKLPDGKVVKVTALLVDSITSVWPGFAERYEALTPTADLIAYNGHAGLGQNVRALAGMGKWQPGKYQVFFMNGCDTFAYVDGALAETRAALNPDDPSGTKYMEFVTNAMPSYFHSMAAASTAVISGFMSVDAPKTYDEIFEGIDDAEIVLVTGEEDNVFEPGMPIGSK